MTAVVDIQPELQRITDIIIQNCNPEKVILFGSQATGTAQDDSDIDLLVVMVTEKRFIERLLYLAELTQPEVAIDFLAYTPGEFEQLISEGNLFLKEEVLKGGGCFMSEETKDYLTGDEYKGWLRYADDDLMAAKQLLFRELKGSDKS